MSQLFQTLRFRKSVKNDGTATPGDTNDEEEKKMAAESLKEGDTCSLVLPSVLKHPKVFVLLKIPNWVFLNLCYKKVVTPLLPFLHVLGIFV